MRKHELRAALKAAARIAGEREFLLIGSQALHASCKRPPAEVLLSQECDLYPRTHSQAAVLLGNELGRNSAFARKHGFYVDIVTPDLASLPMAWHTRLKPFRAGRVTAFCLEVHDLLASKLAAGRLKDLELASAVLKLRLARVPTLRFRISRLSPTSARKQACLSLATVVRQIRSR